MSIINQECDNLHILKKYSNVLLEEGRKSQLYIHPDRISVRNILSLTDRSFWIFEGISHASRFFISKEFINSHTHLSRYFFTLPWYHDRNTMSKALQFLHKISTLEVGKDQIIVLANGFDELSFALDLGYKNSILCNHNAWLKEDLFQVHNLEKLYDLVINTRPENWKRPFLAKDVEKLAVIKGYNFRPKDYYELDDLNPLYINHSRITPEQICKILNQSYVGGIFSELEGGCYSSSEYLLCGIPVVSTQSKGGRDVWYDDNNSIVVNVATSTAVRLAVDELKSRVLSGNISAIDIRNSHINKSKEFRGDFKKLVQSFMLDVPSFNVDSWFDVVFTHKMVEYRKFILI